MYGISQNPDTKDYVMVLEDGYCEKCGEKYTSIEYKWCKPCHVNYLRNNFTDWTSGSEKIDNFIQEMQLKIKVYNNIVFEWIPFNQFNNFEEISNDSLYSAIWKDGPLSYDTNTQQYKRISNSKFFLRFSSNSQNVNECLNKVFII